MAIAKALERAGFARNTWEHNIPDGVDYTEALTREYWGSVVEKFRAGDTVVIHSFDHRIQFTMLVLDVNTATDPVFLDAVFLPVYPPDLRLPALPPQRAARYVVRQAPGLGGSFHVVDTATGKLAREHAVYRAEAMALAADLER